MTTSIDQLSQWLSEPEGTHLEFKEARSGFDFERLLKYCVALANEGGGKIVLGVTDVRPRHIVGTRAFEEPGRTEAGLHQRLMHRIPVEEFHHPDGRLIIVHVPGRLPGTAWQIDGRYLKRAGDDLTALSDHELKQFFAETGPDFSAETCPNAKLSELLPKALSDFRARWAKKSGDDRKLAWNDRETLINAELLVGESLTYAALILFGSRESLGRHLAQAEVVFEYRSSEASGPAADREEYREGFFAWYDALWQKINLRNDKQSYQDGLFRLDIPTFDEIQVREALLNAVAHRDYRHGGSVFFRQYVQRLEIVSPGGFPPGITQENVLDQQNPRNRRLAEALTRCGLIERSGQGMNLMFEHAVRQGKTLPSFSGTSSHEVRLTLDGKLRSPAFVKFLERLGEQTLRSFATDDFLALDRIRNDQALSPQLKERLPTLIDVGAVEAIGRGKGTHYILSAELYAAMGAKGTHTRKKGLDHETNKELLLKHIANQKEQGAPLAELRQVLPALSDARVQALLNEMRTEEKIDLDGQRRWARWKLPQYTSAKDF